MSHTRNIVASVALSPLLLLLASPSNFNGLADAYSLGGGSRSAPFVTQQRLNSRLAFAASSNPPLWTMMGMAQPEIQIKTKTTVETKQKSKVLNKEKVKTGDPVQKRKEEFQDAPMFKLMLLSDDSYDPEHVISRMCAIMEDLDEDHAATVYKAAMSTGKAMCGTYPYEIAELYKEQLIRSDPMIFADMQED
jgi:ATP-dependent Clp protease adapter protein ClpS